VPAGVTVKVVENTVIQVHVVLPPKPTLKLSDEALDKVAGAGSGCWCFPGPDGRRPGDAL
jgi:hypothetical protein